MTPKPLVSYLGRFVLPLLLLLAALGAWYLAAELGSTDRAEVVAGEAQELAAPLVSVRRLPEFATASLQTDSVATALALLPEAPGGLSCVSVRVDGVSILEIAPDLALVPSYAQLLVTGHAAIELLGPDFRYETVVLARELPTDDGTVDRDLYLVGGGDPVLMTRNYAFGFRPPLTTHTSIETLAQAVAEAGVQRVNGGVIAVERRYDQQRSLPGWPEQYALDGLVGPLTALQLDDGFVERAAANLGVAVPAADPAVFAGERFVDELAEIGIPIGGATRSLQPDEDLSELVPVAQVASAPLSEIVFQMLATNDATAAEMIVKELGIVDRGEGSTQAGGRAIQRVLQQQGVEIPVAFRDGSGLDPIGGVTCNQLMMTADTIASGHPTLDALPSFDLPGVSDGQFSSAEVRADLRLVGGQQGDASGFVARTTDQGRRVTIVSIINRPGGPTAGDTAYQQALIAMVDNVRSSIGAGAIAVGE